MRDYDDYYVNIRWLTLVLPVLGVGIYEVIRYYFLQDYFSYITNGMILMGSVGFFGMLFTLWLFKKIRTIHNTLFWEQQRLKTIFNHTSDGIIVIDEECRILDINPAAEELTGWDKKEVIGSLTCNEMIGCSENKEVCWNADNPESCMNVDCGHRECWGKTAMQKMISFPYIEMCVMKKNGQKIKASASYSYIPLVGEEKPQVKIVLRDISERKEFEMAIQNYATLEERYRLAREMHDGLAQTMVYINLKAHKIQRSLENSDCSQALLVDVVELRHVIQEAVDEVRQNIYDLKVPPVKETSCFRVWIEDYLEYIGNVNHIETEFICNCSDALILSTEAKVQLIRIIQEALTNIKKHASATKTTVIINKGSKKMTITITDNGCGINVDTLKMNSKNHFGLAIMQERAQIIGGYLKILPNHPRGTLLEITIPLTKLASKDPKAERGECDEESQSTLSR